MPFREKAGITGTDATGEGSSPPGAVAGDFLIACITRSSSSATITGTQVDTWTLQEPDPNPADFSTWCYVPQNQSGDSATPTWTFSTAGNWTVDIVAYSGVSGVDVDTGEQGGSTSQMAATAQALTALSGLAVGTAVLSASASGAATGEGSTTGELLVGGAKVALPERWWATTAAVGVTEAATLPDRRWSVRGGAHSSLAASAAGRRTVGPSERADTRDPRTAGRPDQHHLMGGRG